MTAFALQVRRECAMHHTDQDRLQETIGYQFQNMRYLSQALMHTSYSNETYAKSQSHLETGIFRRCGIKCSRQHLFVSAFYPNAGGRAV